MPTIIAQTIVPTGHMTLTLAQMLAGDIPADRFARLSGGVRSNHPAFCLGHLAIYADRTLQIINRDDLADPSESFVELFGMGKECVDDAGGSIYPSKDEIVGRFVRRHEVALGALADAPDELMSAPNPLERMASRLPTLGAQVSFWMSGHAMTHLGQLSAWRRMEGMGSAM